MKLWRGNVLSREDVRIIKAMMRSVVAHVNIHYIIIELLFFLNHTLYILRILVNRKLVPEEYVGCPTGDNETLILIKTVSIYMYLNYIKGDSFACVWSAMRMQFAQPFVYF